MEDETKKMRGPEGTVEGKLEDEIWELIDYAKDLSPDTPEYDKSVHHIITLYDSWIAGAKVGNEYQDREEARKHEMKLKEMELQDRESARIHEMAMKKMEIDAKRDADRMAYQIKQFEVIDANQMKSRDWLQAALDVGKIVAPLGTLIGVTLLGWRNENNPIKPLMITSNTTRQSTGLLGKFINVK